MSQVVFPKQIHAGFRVAFNVSHEVVKTQWQCVLTKANIKISKYGMEQNILRNNKEKERLLSYF